MKSKRINKQSSKRLIFDPGLKTFYCKKMEARGHSPSQLTLSPKTQVECGQCRRGGARRACGDCKEMLMARMESTCSLRILRWRSSILEANALSRRRLDQALLSGQVVRPRARRPPARQSLKALAPGWEGFKPPQAKFSSFGTRKVKENLTCGRFFQTTRLGEL
jgi:hypothetical protein